MNTLYRPSVIKHVPISRASATSLARMPKTGSSSYTRRKHRHCPGSPTALMYFSLASPVEKGNTNRSDSSSSPSLDVAPAESSSLLPESNCFKLASFFGCNSVSSVTFGKAPASGSWLGVFWDDVVWTAPFCSFNPASACCCCSA